MPVSNLPFKDIVIHLVFLGVFTGFLQLNACSLDSSGLGEEQSTPDGQVHPIDAVTNDVLHPDANKVDSFDSFVEETKDSTIDTLDVGVDAPSQDVSDTSLDSVTDTTDAVVQDVKPDSVIDTMLDVITDSPSDSPVSTDSADAATDSPADATFDVTTDTADSSIQDSAIDAVDATDSKPDVLPDVSPDTLVTDTPKDTPAETGPVPCTDKDAVRGNNGHCYIPVGFLNLTGDEAKSTCEKLSPPAHLVTISNSEEQNIVNNFGGERWIGLRKGTSGNFEWITGEPVTYTNWKSGEPSGDGSCVRMMVGFDNGKWGDRACSSAFVQLQAVCERE